MALPGGHAALRRRDSWRTPLTQTARPITKLALTRARWAGVFLALAVTCLLSLIPMKIPALSPFWLHDALSSQTTTSLSEPDDGWGGKSHVRRRAARMGARDAQSMLAALEPAAPPPNERTYETKTSYLDRARLYAGIRANSRIPVKRVRQIALPPPSRVHLRAPPTCA